MLLAPDVFGAHSSEAIGRRSRGPQAGSLAAPVSHRGAVSGKPMVDGGRFGHCHAALCFVLTNPDALVEDFAAAASAAAMEGWPCEIRTEILRAPHRRPPLPAGFAAVYVFALAEEYGRATPAGAGAVLKVGRVGPASGPRFSYQHYGFAALNLGEEPRSIPDHVAVAGDRCDRRLVRQAVDAEASRPCPFLPPCRARPRPCFTRDVHTRPRGECVRGSCLRPALRRR